jgi:hypothetical protein
MWKIAIVLLLTAAAMFGARLAYHAPFPPLRGGELSIATPPLMYAGVRG